MLRNRALATHKFLSFKKRRRRRGETNWLFLASIAASALFVVILVGSLVGFAAFAYYSKDLPAPGKLVVRDRALSTKIFDREGRLLYDVYGEQNRTLATLGDLPDDLIHATLAAEDADFYAHSGFDLLGILRAAYNILRYRTIEGGSTITQQLVRNTLISRERTLPRKAKEFILALQIEKKYSKEEILEMYLNEAPYGGQAYGVEAAADVYFQKSAKDLSLAEASFLAGLSQAPSRYSPYGSEPERAEARRKYVLHLMETRGWLEKNGERGFLSAEEAQAAREVVLSYASPGAKIRAPHFVMYIKELLTERYGASLLERGGLQVTTTLDLEKHERLQAIVSEEIEKVRKYQIGNGALLAINSQTGEILSMVGSADFFDDENDGQVNVVLRERQPGSAIKPITYVTAFAQGYTPATTLFDVPTTFPGGQGQPDYKPVNYDGEWRGPLALRYALGNSVNMVAVKLLKLVGIPGMLEMARNLGISTLTDPSRYGLSLTLGGGEVKLIDLVSAYSTFSAGGRKVQPQAILEVKDSSGHVLETLKPTEGAQVLSEEVAYLISNILSDNNARTLAFGSRSALHIPGYSVAAKTGTTNNMRDNWTVGYTRSFAVGVWVGNNDNSPMGRLVSGVTGAAPIWNRVMRELLSGNPDEPFYPPEGIAKATVCTLSGQLPSSWCIHEQFRDECETREEYFIKSTVPTQECPAHSLLEICRDDGKLASDACRQAGEVEEKIFVDFKAALPEWQEFVDSWISETYGDDSKYHPPTEVSDRYFNPDGDDKPWVKIIDPEATNQPLEFEVLVEVVTPYTVNKVEFYLGGDQVGDAVTSIPYGKRVVLSVAEVGNYELKVLAYDSAGNVGEATKDITVADD